MQCNRLEVWWADDLSAAINSHRFCPHKSHSHHHHHSIINSIIIIIIFVTHIYHHHHHWDRPPPPPLHVIKEGSVSPISFHIGCVNIIIIFFKISINKISLKSSSSNCFQTECALLPIPIACKLQSCYLPIIRFCSAAQCSNALLLLSIALEIQCIQRPPPPLLGCLQLFLQRKTS